MKTHRGFLLSSLFFILLCIEISPALYALNYRDFLSSVRPIVWDDMLRTIPEDVLLASGAGRVVEPMVWVYVEDVDRFVDPSAWATYANVFPHVWAASAFKVGSLINLILWDIESFAFFVLIRARSASDCTWPTSSAMRQTTRYNKLNKSFFPIIYLFIYLRTQAWLEVMRREEGAAASNSDVNNNALSPSNPSVRMRFRGIALTGWSRYDHFAVLCELLPSSVPSLVLGLALLAEGAHDREAARRAHAVLGCPVAAKWGRIKFVFEIPATGGVIPLAKQDKSPSNFSGRKSRLLVQQQQQQQQ